MSHLSRFNELSELANLEESISYLRLTVELVDDGHPDQLTYVFMLGVSQMQHYDCVGDFNDFKGSFPNLKMVVWLTDKGHPDRAEHISVLDRIRLQRYERLGEHIDIEDSVSNLQDAVQLIDDNHPDKVMDYSNLGKSQLRQRYRQLADLKNSIGPVGTLRAFRRPGRCRGVHLELKQRDSVVSRWPSKQDYVPF